MFAVLPRISYGPTLSSTGIAAQASLTPTLLLNAEAQWKVRYATTATVRQETNAKAKAKSDTGTVRTINAANSRGNR